MYNEGWIWADLFSQIFHLPASSKWPFDNPNGGHLTPEKVTSNTQKGHWEEAGSHIFLAIV